MTLIKQTEEYVVDTEDNAIKVIEHFRKEAAEKGYLLGASGYTYKCKKAKGEIVDECYLVKITKVFGGIWD